MTTALRTVVAKAHYWYLRGYFSVRNAWPVWYGLLNRTARHSYALHKPVLLETQRNILDDLRRDGIAFTTLDVICPGENKLKELQYYMQTLEQLKESVTKKGFLRSFWELKPTISFSNPFFKLALSPFVLAIVNSYDEMWRRFNYSSLAETIPVGDKAPEFSQRWHRDNEEKRMVKLFIYLSDVDSEAGPFTYVKGSQYKGKYGTLFPQQLPLGVYPDAGAVEKNVESKDIITATGKAGTVIFCDTAGLHRGGHAKSKHRIMFTAFYPSNWWTEEPRYAVSDTTRNTALAPEARYALFLD